MAYFRHHGRCVDLRCVGTDSGKADPRGSGLLLRSGKIHGHAGGITSGRPGRPSDGYHHNRHSLRHLLRCAVVFVYQTASLERCGPLAALARSSNLVGGNWWRVFGILLLMFILWIIASSIAGAVLGLVPYAGPIVVAVLFAPVQTIVQTLVYHDLRVRRDGLTGYGPEVLASELESSQGL